MYPWLRLCFGTHDITHNTHDNTDARKAQTNRLRRTDSRIHLRCPCSNRRVNGRCDRNGKTPNQCAVHWTNHTHFYKICLLAFQPEKYVIFISRRPSRCRATRVRTAALSHSLDNNVRQKRLRSKCRHTTHRHKTKRNVWQTETIQLEQRAPFMLHENHVCPKATQSSVCLYI